MRLQVSATTLKTHTHSHPTGKVINFRWSKQTQSWLRPRASAGKIGGLKWQMENLMCLKYIGFSFKVTVAKFWGWTRGWGVGQKASKGQNDLCHLGNETHEQGSPFSSPWLLSPSGHLTGAAQSRGRWSRGGNFWRTDLGLPQSLGLQMETSMALNVKDRMASSEKMGHRQTATQLQFSSNPDKPSFPLPKRGEGEPSLVEALLNFFFSVLFGTQSTDT